MNIVAEYIKYRWNAKGRHGTHSPFIYEMVDRAMKIRMGAEMQSQLHELCRDLRKDNRTIQVSDMGSGSRKMGKTRVIRDIFRNSSSHGKYARLLFQLSSYYQPAKILELGTSLGIGTIHLALGNPNAELSTVEGCPETLNIAKENFDKMNLHSVKAFNCAFDEFFATYNGEPFDLVYIDGHHDGKALLSYLERLEDHTHKDTLFILDDIRWSDSMYESWNSIVQSPEFHVTADLFRMGICLKRPQQEKEHFILSI